MVGGQFRSAYVAADLPGLERIRQTRERIDRIRTIVARYPGTSALARAAADVRRIHKSRRTASMIGIEGSGQIEGADHAGLGSDLDGADNALPDGPGDISNCPALLAEPMRRGWSDADVAKVAGGNVLRAMEGAEAVARSMVSMPLVPATEPPSDR